MSARDRCGARWSSFLVVAACGALLLLSAAFLPSAHAAKTLADVNKPQNVLPCVCSDVDPREQFFNANVTNTCEQQATFVAADGSRVCDQPFMRQTPQELPEGYCQISCGRCPCCKPAAEVLAARGFSQYVELIKQTPYKDAFATPSFMGTLLAVSDQAISAALDQLGFGSVYEASQAAPDTLRSLGLLHIIPPVPDTKAVWSTPFFVTGKQLPTALARSSGGKPVTLGVKRVGNAITLSGPKNEARVVETDVEFCKGYIQVIDSVLLPA